jgi:NAD(P) transhydrogenase subunit alpha
VGALTSAKTGNSRLAAVLGLLAIILATVNVVGGYLVTHRMLNMFRKRK